MTTESELDLKAGRRRVARSRGALSGVLLIILGAWAALAPFIGPYFDFGFTPRPDDAWHWTSGRGLYEVLPGGVAVLAGLLLLFSASRLLTVVVAWFAALAGAWLVVAPSLASIVNVEIGAPVDLTNENKTAAQSLLYFFATGVAIAVVAGVALGRLSTHSVRDVRAAERRAEAQAAENQRLEDERAAEAARLDEQRRHEDEQRRVAESATASAVPLDKPDFDKPADAGPHDTVVAGHAPAAAGDHGSGPDRSRTEQADERPTTDTSAQQSPFTPAGPRDTAGSTGYLGARTDSADAPVHEQPTAHQPAVVDRDSATRELPATPQAYPPPPPAEPRQG